MKAIQEAEPIIPIRGLILPVAVSSFMLMRGTAMKATWIVAALVLAGCATAPAPAPAGHQPGEEAQVLATVDAYMREISANDLAAMNARQTPEGMTYRIVHRGDGGWDVVARPNAWWVAPERADNRTYSERYWSPTVLVRGAMALVWAPYEFGINGQTSHCGVDVFSLARFDGTWKVSNSMWTVEPKACAELRPADPALIRPAN